MIIGKSEAETDIISCQSRKEPGVLRVIICDDDHEFLSSTKKKVEEILEKLGEKTVVHAFLEREAIGGATLASCDIALLDVDFCNKPYNGIDIAVELRALRDDAVIIFLTNFIEYAPIGYELNAFRYILKNQVTPLLDRYLPQAVSRLKETKETIKVQVNGEIIDIVIKRIHYIEVEQHNVSIHVLSNSQGTQERIYRINTSLSSLEKKLAPFGFLRIHKSFLVNMEYIKIFQCRKCLLKSGIQLRVSEKNYAERKKTYMEWKGVL